MQKSIYIFLVAMLVLLAGLAARAEDLAIIVGKKTSVDTVTTAELVKIFRAEKSKTPDGTKFVILMREPGSAERIAALKGIYQMSDQEYQKYFLQATFTGAVASAPKQLPTAAAVKAFVAGNPGAIGYVKAGDLDDSVKAVKIDGKSPGDADYSLKLK